MPQPPLSSSSAAENTENARRAARALGGEPIPDARYLLAPVALPPPEPEPPPGPQPGVEFVMEGDGGIARWDAAAVVAALHAADRSTLGFPVAWIRRPDAKGWERLETEEGSVFALALTWELSGLLISDVREAAELLARHAKAAEGVFERLGWQPSLSEPPAAAAERALRLIALRERFARSVEMRLLPVGRRFPAREVWRAAYSLGLTWGGGGAMNLFAWREPSSGTPLFTLSALGGGGATGGGYGAGGFLPERAEEGEGVAGLALGFELPTSPAPVAAYDRMAVALDYLRQRLGGRPAAPDGADLDAERLWSDRDALVDAVAEMTRAGIAPGSAAARRFF